MQLSLGALSRVSVFDRSGGCPKAQAPDRNRPMSAGNTLGGPGSLFVVDANNFVFRAYHGLPMLTSPKGTPVNAVHGYVRMLQAMRREHAPQHMGGD